jgi:replicative DNA helicase
VAKKLFSLNLEQHVLGGLLKNPAKFFEISQFLQADDFGDPSRVNNTLYSVIGSMISNNTPVDPVLVAQNISSLKINFEHGVSAYDYLQSLSLRPVSEESIVPSAKIIKKFSARRAIIENADKIKREISELPDDSSFDNIVKTADSIFNNQLDLYFNHSEQPQNIFEDMEANIEYRGENPLEELGPMSPYPRVNELCGSLFLPGNITVIASRYGVGKTTLALDVATRVGIQYNIPVLHFDNGEMSYEELQNRMCAANTKVPLYLITSGKWRQNEQFTNTIRAFFKRIKDQKWRFFYYNVGGLDYDEMINIARRWYYSNVGRGNKMILSYDYIKLSSLKEGNDNFWAGIGEMLNAMKTFIQKEIVFENKPQISLFTSVQANRQGISQNVAANEIQDNERSIGLSDQIGQIATHLFILRKKLAKRLSQRVSILGRTNSFLLSFVTWAGTQPAYLI